MQWCRLRFSNTSPILISELKDIQRVLRPGGLLLLQAPNYRTLSILLGRDDFRLNTPPQYLNYFTPKTLRKLLLQNGFRVMQMRTGERLEAGEPVGPEIPERHHERN